VAAGSPAGGKGRVIAVACPLLHAETMAAAATATISALRIPGPLAFVVTQADGLARESLPSLG
jgi:hypothetical protein